MAGTFFDQNGVEHALTPETQALANALPSRFDTGQPPVNDSFGVDPGSLPPLTPPPFVGTPSQAPAGFSGVSPATAFPAIPGAGATGTWDAAPAATSTVPPAVTQNTGGLEVVEGNGATAAAQDTAPSTMPAIPQFSESSRTTVGGLTGSALQGLNTAYDASAKAIDAQAKVANDRVAAESESLRAKEALARSFRIQEEAKQAEVEQRKADWENKMKSADDKYRGASIDSGRLWRDSSTGSKIAGGIGIMLGALSQALTGKDNPALKIIDAAIDRDIDVQKANMEKAGKEAGMTRSAYSTYLEATGSEAAARNRIKMLAYDEIGAKLDAAAANSKSPEIAANALASKAALDVKKAETIAKDSTYQKVTEIAPVVAKPVAVGATRWPQATGDDMRARGNVMKAGARIENMLGDTKKMEKVMGPIDAKVRDLASNFGFPVDEDYLSYKTETGALVASILKQMSGVGVNEKEYQRWASILPMIQKNPENAKAEFKAFMEREREEYEGARTSHAANLANPEDRATFDATWPSTVQAKNAAQGFNAK